MTQHDIMSLGSLSPSIIVTTVFHAYKYAVFAFLLFPSIHYIYDFLTCMRCHWKFRHKPSLAYTQHCDFGFAHHQCPYIAVCGCQYDHDKDLNEPTADILTH